MYPSIPYSAGLFLTCQHSESGALVGELASFDSELINFATVLAHHARMGARDTVNWRLIQVQERVQEMVWRPQVLLLEIASQTSNLRPPLHAMFLDRCDQGI